jgi:hypothetical protein
MSATKGKTKIRKNKILQLKMALIIRKTMKKMLKLMWMMNMKKAQEENQVTLVCK